MRPTIVGLREVAAVGTVNGDKIEFQMPMPEWVQVFQSDYLGCAALTDGDSSEVHRLRRQRFRGTRSLR